MLESPHPYIEAAIEFARFSDAEHDWFERPPKPGAILRMTPVTDLPKEARLSPASRTTAAPIIRPLD
jgi:hypothetical protein